mmetsp:Transcript_14963/g.32122  ORF Transcript_14963/g.32122 Transcript_14963/m.32122 type:complete len:210 (+) Transcript_14963:221-850(+)|eukprot:CAMPEP_0185848834 /NCGR_PEP_ID=MMETSP1354-20130828/3563_1 /TAXON_ID=708628 /ORGANISM="Erythrolobus madagascarensis, Strain CCMP3276" /LENGTH=209 /DNA_ID=CAMNT_0028549281 /DNA_START=126 /DNA_END=755 /DNA_ORIENTATION=+
MLSVRVTRGGLSALRMKGVAIDDRAKVLNGVRVFSGIERPRTNFVPHGIAECRGGDLKWDFEGSSSRLLRRRGGNATFGVEVRRGMCNARDGSDAEATIRVRFVLRDGTEKVVVAKAGENVMEIAHANDIDLEGACEGSLACSTCHVYVEQEYFEKLPEACEDEIDMLDLAFSPKDTSRLGCQIKVEKSLDGITVTLPPLVRSLANDGD